MDPVETGFAYKEPPWEPKWMKIPGKACMCQMVPKDEDALTLQV